MAIEIVVGGWEHECCGPEIERTQRVEWTYIIHTDGRLYETHHELEDLRTGQVSGTVVDLELMQVDGSRVPITRVPSGGALRASEGVVTALRTDESLDASTHEFVVTVEPDR